MQANRLPAQQSEADRQAAVKEEFKKYYNTNFGNNFSEESQFSIDEKDLSFQFNENDGIVTADISFTYDSVTMKFFRLGEMKIAVSGSAVYKVKPDNYVIDLVMCIDATGSMTNTIESVKQNATSFADELAEAIEDIPQEQLKIRVRPIFYRDVSDENAYDPTLNPQYEGGLIEHTDFIDLNPSDSMGVTQETQGETFRDFIASEDALAGGDTPEAAGACLDEGLRSNWFDNQVQEAKDYFNIPAEHKVISFYDDKPSAPYSKVTTIPVLVFWTDAPVQSLQVTNEAWSTVPTTYAEFESRWNDSSVIDQELKLMLMFGPVTASGWSEIREWDRFSHGGSLQTGNENGISVIAKEIKKILPSPLRLTN